MAKPDLQPSAFILKARWFARASWRQFVSDVAGPLKERLGPSKLIPYGVVLFVAYRLGGVAGMWGKLSTEAAVIWATIATIPVFAVAQLLAAPFKAHSAAKSAGRWHSNEFILNDRKLIFSCRVVARDPVAVTPFAVPGVPGRGYITYEIEFHPENPYWNGCLAFPAATPHPEIHAIKMGGSGGIRVPDNRRLALMAWSNNPNASSVIVRVWLHSWHAGSVPG